MTNAAPNHFLHRLRFLRGPAGVAFSAALLILVIGGWQIQRARTTALDETIETTRNLTRSLTQHAARSIEALDLVLSGLVERVEGGALNDLPRLKGFLHKRAEDVGQTGNLIVLNEVGDWVAASSTEPYNSTSNLDRDYFIHHLRHDDLALRIGSTIIGRYNGKPVIPLTRRWNKPDGSFGGVIVAALDPEYFQKFYEKLGVGEHGVIAMISDDQRFLVRHPYDAKLVDRSLANLAIFRDGLSKSRQGTLRYLSGIDGVERIAAFEHLESYPVAMMAARGVDDVLLPWREEAIIQSAILVLVASVLVGLGVGLARHQSRSLQAEVAIRESNAQHREVLDTANDAFVSVGPDGVITFWNASAQRIFGWTASHAVGRPLAALIVPERFRDAHERGMARYITTSQGTLIGRRLELVALRNDQSEFPIELTLSVSRNAEGLSFHGFIQDISERTLREQALRDSEALHRLLSENSGDMIAVKSAFEGARSYVSPACRTVVGWTAAEFATIPASEHVHPDDFERVQSEYAALTAENSVVTSIHRVRHKEGRWIWVEATFRLAEAGTVDERVIATSRDITARREAEEALLVSEARYRLLAETSTDMIVLADLDSLKRYVSPASREILGYEPEELIGTRAGEMVHPDDATQLSAVVASLANGSAEQATSTHRFLRKDGNYVWVETQCKLIRHTPTAPASGYIAVVRDVSERHRQAQELHTAKDAAEAAANAKGEFLASMSHELRTPLNAIIGFSRLMVEEREMAVPTMHRYARLVQDASTTLLSIVNDVLDVSKLEAGSLDLDPHPFSPRDLVESVATLLRGQAEAKGLALHIEADPSLPAALVGDDSRLRQVLLNLLSNAVKFTAKGMVWVFVGCEREEHGIARVRFSVMDTGIGIPTDRRHRLFKRFSQVDNSTARQFGGTGLGLSICKSLVEVMGGSIVVDSVEGEGTTFSFLLDLPVAEAIPTTPELAVLQSAVIPSSGAHILLAEDVAMNQELAVALLTKWGHTVEVAPDGATAVAAVMRTRFDLVLMDVQMPVMDGIEATRRIRALGGSYATLAIVAMTANVMSRDIAICREAGLDDHIGKPFVPETLRLLVERLTASTNERVADLDNEHIAARHMVLDPIVFDDLVELMGPASVGSLLSKLKTHLEKKPLSATNPSVLSFEAHALVSSCGMLGLNELSAVCHALELACESVDGERPQLSTRLTEAHAAIERALACLEHQLVVLTRDQAA